MTSAARPISASPSGRVSVPSNSTATSHHRNSNSNVGATRGTTAKSASSVSSAMHATTAAASASFDSQAAPLDVDGSIPPAPPGPPAAVVVVAATADGASASMLTVSQLESQSSAPAAYTGSGGRHVKDEIDELLYALQVREREIRMTRGGLETEIGNIRRSVKKMQRDTEELVRLQQQHTASMGSTLANT